MRKERLKQVFLSKIKQNFPKLIFSKAELNTSGWDDNVIILDNKIVFSFPKDELDSHKKFQKELKIMPLLNKSVTLSIPNYIYIPKNKSFAGYEFIPGVPFTNNILKRLNKKNKIRFAKQIAKFLSELHSVPITKAKRNGVTVAWTEREARLYYTKRARKVFKRLGYNFLSLQKLLGKHPIKEKSDIAVIHQDFTSDHILFDTKAKKIRGIIDFGDVQIADPARDFSTIWDYGEAFLDLVLRYYKINDRSVKERSLRWWIYNNINLVEFGYEKNIRDMWKKGYGRLKELFKN